MHTTHFTLHTTDYTLHTTHYKTHTTCSFGWHEFFQIEDIGHRTDDRGQRTDDRGLRREDRGLKARGWRISSWFDLNLLNHWVPY